MAIKKNKKIKRKVMKGIAYINATFNNTLVTITDEEGNTIAWSTPAVLGFQNSRKGTAFVATKAGEDASNKAKQYGLQEVDVILKGPGAGRASAIKGIASSGIRILTLKDSTPIKHGGCKSRKAPRK